MSEDAMFEAADPWRLTDEAWAWVQCHRWAYDDGTPYEPKRDDTYMEHRDALATAEGWAYRESLPEMFARLARPDPEEPESD
jgi:hypothetical protein